MLQLALGHDGEAYVFGARAPLTRPDWRGPWDCAEFASWCLFQATGIVYGAEPRDRPMAADPFTGTWEAHARRFGRTVSASEAATIEGAFLLRAPTTARTGHIAISDGRGGTIEAHSTAQGVGRHRVAGRRWDMGVLVPGVDYFRADTDPDPPDPPRDVLRVTHPMMRGPRVERVQRRLVELGLRPGASDGVYGPQTADAVQRFQVAHGLVADGEVGPATWEAFGL